MKTLILTLLFILLTQPSFCFAEKKLKPPEQKAILVTGASSGIGKNIALTLAKKGYFVYAGARKKADLEALSTIKNIQGIKLDVTIQKEIDAAVATITQEGRGLYGLVNNAGVAVMEPLIEVSEETMQYQMDVNVFGPYRITKAFAPLIIKSKGRITTIGSILGVISSALTGPYSMSKHAVEAFTGSLSAEMKKFDVKVSVIEPGNYNSNVISSMRKRMNAEALDIDESLYKQEQLGLEQYIPAERSKYKSPDEVASAVMHALFDPNPKLRYLVVPTKNEAQYTISGIIKKLVQLNKNHPFTYDREALILMLDEALK